jgi:hypothetical protein
MPRSGPALRVCLLDEGELVREVKAGGCWLNMVRLVSTRLKVRLLQLVDIMISPHSLISNPSLQSNF